MAAKRVVVGTDDLVGCRVVSVDYNEMTLEKDGRQFYVELEYEVDYHSMCEGPCCYIQDRAYMIARADAVE